MRLMLGSVEFSDWKTALVALRMSKHGSGVRRDDAHHGEVSAVQLWRGHLRVIAIAGEPEVSMNFVAGWNLRGVRVVSDALIAGLLAHNGGAVPARGSGSARANG